MKLLTLLFLTLSIPVCAQFHNVKGVRIVERTAAGDSTTISGVGQIQYDGDDDKIRFNDGNGWYSFLKEGSIGAAWPLTGSASLTGTTSIDIDGNDLTIGDPTFTEGFIGFSSGVGVLGYGSQYFAADATGIGINLPSGADGDIFYSNENAGFNYLQRLAAAASGNVLLSGTSPSWGKVGLATHVSGTLAVGNGGTGLSAFTANRLLYSATTSTVGQATAGNLLTFSAGTLTLGGTATGATSFAGASQAFDFGTSGSPFGATEFNLGATEFNAGTTIFTLGATTFDLGSNNLLIQGRTTSLNNTVSGSGNLFTINSNGSSVTGTDQSANLEIVSLSHTEAFTTTNNAILRISAGDISGASSYSGNYRNIWIAPTATGGTNLSFNPNAGTGNWFGLVMEPTFNTTGTYSGTARGVYYNPTLTSVTGLTNIAWENTSGLVRFGEGIQIDEGTNETMGTATLSSGTITVNTTKVTANSRIFLTVNGGTLTNVGTPYISARVAGTSFTITSTNGSDASDVAWLIIEPAP